MTLMTKFIIFIVAILILLVTAIMAYRDKKYNKGLGFVGIIYGVIYMVWRIFFTLPVGLTFDFFFGILLVLVEIMALENTIIIKLLFSTNKTIKVEEDLDFSNLPSVDVFIATYNEPIAILKRTILAANNIDYPKDKLNIYVGDDGNRDTVKDLCQEIGVHHITRTESKHAKAGNINNMIANSTGKYILTLDADMIPAKEIIKKMIYYFEDSKTGFVQAPQVFYNHDIFQYNLELGDGVPNEQDFFMRTLLEKRAVYNAVLHVGSNAIFSRQALEDIGGIPTSSITEDMATGMLIQAKGYKSFFVNEPLAIGLSVENINDLIKQRDRWLRGNIQVFKSINPFFTKGLSLAQKMIYFDGVVYWAYGLQKMIYIIAPLLYLFFRVMIFDANGYDVAMMFIPYFLSNALYFRAVSENGRNITWSHIYETATAPFMAFSFLTEMIFSKELKFNVTPKGEVSGKDIFNWRLAMPHLILATLSLVSLVLNSYYLVNLQIENYSALVINVFWCCYNLFGITISIFVYIDRKRYRVVERIPVDLQLQTLIKSCEFKDGCSKCGCVKDISDNGASIEIKKSCSHFDYQIDDKFKIQIQNIGEVDCIVKRVASVKNNYLIGVEFENLSFDEYVAINDYRFKAQQSYLNNPAIQASSGSFSRVFLNIARSMVRKR